MSGSTWQPFGNAGLGLRCGGLILMVGCLSGCLADCGGMEEAIAGAQALPKERLELLYVQLSAQRSEALASRSGSSRYGEGQQFPIPAQFSDLRARGVILDDTGHARIHLAGCWDNKVMLIVRSLDDPSRARIDLHRGENEPGIELWGGGR
jgi:hypothetical protein